MKVDEILARLDRVRQTGARAWSACCPAHVDKSPSLSVRELPDGRILLHDFGGCDTQAVLDSLGLAFSDLFSGPIGEGGSARHHFTAGEALRALASEAAVVAIAASDIGDGKRIDQKDAARVRVAAGRIAEAWDLACGGLR